MFERHSRAPDGARLPYYLNTRTLGSHLFYGPYIYFPLIAGLTWLGGILALLAIWVKQGKPRYQSDEATVVFISDVGAANQTLFICICSVTAAFYILSLLAERWLRHIDRLPTDIRVREKVFDWIAIAFAVVGSAALILLSVCDAFDYSTIHWISTCVFVLCVAFSAIFQTGEIWSLHKDHPDRPSLLRNSILKLFVVTIAIALAVGFAVCYGICDGNATATKGHSAATCNRVTSAAAALEWSVAFWLFFYFLTLVADLWPAGKSSPRYMRRLARWQERHGEGDDFTGRRAFGVFPERWTTRDRVDARASQMQADMKARNEGVRPMEQAHIDPAAPRMGMATTHAGNPDGYSSGYGPNGQYGYEDNRPSMASSQAPMVR
ncbi:hypothetical protein Q5752_001326 [Cryptotrichosporon argae]